MRFQLTPYAVVLFISAVATAAVAIAIWHRRTARGGMTLFWFTLAVIEWQLTGACGAAAVGLQAKLLWSKINYIGVLSAPVLLFTFALEYAQRERVLTRRNLALLWVVPILSFGLTVTNEWHHLIWTSFTPSADPARNVIVYGRGTWFWVIVAYAYVLLFIATLMLALTALRYRRLYRRQMAVLLLAMPFPWLGNILYVFNLGPFLGQDLTPVGLMLVSALLAVSLFEFRFLDLVPMARDAVVETMSDGVLVLDAEGRILDVNPAARQLLDSDALRVGTDIGTALAARPELAEICQAAEETQAEVLLPTMPQRYIDVRCANLRNRRGASGARLIVMRDVTEQKRAEMHSSQRADQLALLNDIGSRVAGELDVARVMERAVRLVQESFDYHHVALFILDREEEVLAMGPRAGAFVDLFPPDHHLKLGQGMVGWVGQEGETLLVNDVDAEPRYVNLYANLIPTQSELSVPVRVDGELAGVLDVQSPRRNAFDASDVMVMESLADQIAVAIKNARLFGAEQERRQVAETLRQAAAVLSSTLELSGVLDLILKQLREVIPYGSASIQRLEDGQLEVVACQGFEALDEVMRLVFPLDPKFPNCSVVMAKEPLAMEDVVHEYPHFQDEAETYESDRIRSWLGVPLMAKDRVIGMIAMDRFEVDPFTAEESQLAMAFANQAAIAIENARLYEQAQREIEERKRAQEALRKSRERYRSLFEDTPVGLYRSTAYGKILHANPALVQMLGYPDLESLLKTSALDLYPEPEARTKRVSLMETSDGLISVESQLRRYDGQILWVLDTSRAVRDDEGRIQYYDGALEDITERKLAEEARRESEERLRTAGKVAYDLIYEWDVARDSLKWFGDIDGMLGRRQGEISEDINAWLDLIHPDDVARLEDAVERHRTSTEPIVYEYRVRHKDGTYRYWIDHGLPLLDSDGRPNKWVGVCTDVTERQEMEEQLRQHERLAAVGQLAAGIAHDFRNLLTTIMMYAEITLRDGDLPPYLVQNLETIIGESERAADLVQQLLDFGRRSMIEPQPLDIRPFLEGVLDVLRPAIPEDILLTLDVRPKKDISVPLVKADPGRIQQALTNLALNARDAMPEGGELRFALSRVVVAPDTEPPVAGMPAGEWVCLAVSDSGIGMTEEVREHLFEPFFTTKEVGKGTGLGLAQVYGTVRQHEGYIDVETELGRGTTIFIYLPVYEEEDSSIPPDRAGQVKRDRRAEVQRQRDGFPSTSGEPRPTTDARRPVILLVEDDEGVREAGRRTLQSLGYRVLTGANGSEALARCQSPRWSASSEPHGERGQSRQVDVVIMDLSLQHRGERGDVPPKKGGEAWVKALKEARPALRVVGIIESASESQDRDVLRGAGLVGLVNKPLDPEKLAHAVRQALDVV